MILDLLTCLAKTVKNSCYFYPTDAEEIRQLKTRPIKHMTNRLKTPLKHIFNACMNLNVFSHSLKISKIIPIYKERMQKN